MYIDPVFFSSISRNLSISQNTKRVRKRKAENLLPTLISAPEKRPATVAGSDISLAQNLVSNCSFFGKSFAKVLSPDGMKLHIPVT